MSKPKDIDLQFKRHPVTNDLVVRTGNSALLQSVRNIVLTSNREWKTAQGLGAGAYNNLGENAGEVMNGLNLQQSIVQQITEFEPRVELKTVEVVEENHRQRVIVQFSPVNTTEIVTFDEFVHRVV